jgi:hypothetical protein
MQVDERTSSMVMISWMIVRKQQRAAHELGGKIRGVGDGEPFRWLRHDH